MYQLLSIVELTCILSFVAFAAILTFRFAGFPDLSVDGVFAFGAVVFARLFLAGWSIPLALVGAVAAGMLIGAVTATIASRLRINPLLASVLILTILYSLNLRVLGRANLPVYGVMESAFAVPHARIAILLVLAGCAWLAVFVFFKTELGTALRSTGSSPEYLTAIARNPARYRLLLVALAGGSVAAAGALLALKFGFADVSLGTGTIIIGIASLIIGEKICGRNSLLAQLLAAPVGMVFYQLSVGLAYSIGVSSTDVKLGTGLITITLLALSRDERHKLLD
ncbi:MAG: ABC transporter permease [Candidatus Hydrogenedentes bacterium]|nr:ABC transporter permease [Candidatus Hydrogenedentota bacterium]